MYFDQLLRENKNLLPKNMTKKDFLEDNKTIENKKKNDKMIINNDYLEKNEFFQDKKPPSPVKQLHDNDIFIINKNKNKNQNKKLIKEKDNIDNKKDESHFKQYKKKSKSERHNTKNLPDDYYKIGRGIKCKVT